MMKAVSPTAQIASGCRIGNFVTIGDDVVVGENVHIGHNVVIHEGAYIGAGTTIQDHTVIGRQPLSSSVATRPATCCPPIRIAQECIIGSHVVLYAGVVLQDRVMVADLASIREGSVIKSKASIGRGVLVEYDTVVGERCKIQTGCHLTGNMIIEADVFFGGEVHTMNDKQLDRDKGLPMVGPHIKRGARVGGNATVLPGITVGFDSVVGAGAVVTKDVPDGTIVVGNPARFLKRVPDHLRLADTVQRDYTATPT
ncbi:MAG: DapH/DapD/GlmU-related protein [Phycisphaerae bacterium]